MPLLTSQHLNKKDNPKMGSSSYSDDFYRDRVSSRAASGTPAFKYDDDIKRGKVAAGVHDSLNIKNKIREARDSKEHPNSTPIAVVFDETGSMGGVPKIMQANLPKLMGLLLRKGYIEDPQILFGAVGDYVNREKAPLQIGQFESGIEMDDNITNIFLEGQGGGSYQESYQNAMYFFAHRTSCDAFEKRGKKGYLFLVGDEMPYSKSSASELQTLIADDIKDGVTIERIVASCQEKWEVFFIIPSGTSHFSDPELFDHWAKLIGAQHVMKLEDPAAICETIGLTVGVCEGTAGDDLHADLKDVGATAHVANVATSSVGAIAADRALAKVGTGGTLPAKKGRSEKIERL